MLVKEGYYCKTELINGGNFNPEGSQKDYVNSEDECAKKCLEMNDKTEMFAYGRGLYNKRCLTNTGRCKCYCLPTKPQRVKDHLCLAMKKSNEFALYALECKRTV